jgi:hypothetical protein
VRRVAVPRPLSVLNFSKLNRAAAALLSINNLADAICGNFFCVMQPLLGNSPSSSQLSFCNRCGRHAHRYSSEYVRNCWIRRTR